MTSAPMRASVSPHSGAAAKAGGCDFLVTMSGHYDEGSVRGSSYEVGEGLKSGAVREHVVKQYGIVRAGAKRRQRFAGRFGLGYLDIHVMVRQRVSHDFAMVRLVIHH